MPTLDQLHELLDYDPKTGEFQWLVQGKGHWRDKVGCITTFKNGGKYIVIRLGPRLYLAHRLAWFWMTGKWPKNLIDHEDRDGLNNRWKNLRQATRRQNVTNAKIWSTNTSGATGVGWHKQKQRWRAYFGNKHLGLFMNKSDAIQAAAKARAECWHNI